LTHCFPDLDLEIRSLKFHWNSQTIAPALDTVNHWLQYFLRDQPALFLRLGLFHANEVWAFKDEPDEAKARINGNRRH
jgi:hypothetical protein